MARRGATVAEIVVAIGLATILLVALGTLYLYSTRTFLTMESLIDLDNANRLAVDRISQEIRQATRVLACSGDQLIFERNGQPVRLIFYPAKRQLVREDAQSSQVVLRDCDFVRYEIFQRTPLTGAYGFFPTATVTNCKVVRLSWISSRAVGDLARNQTAMRSAQVVLRNQRL